MKNSVNRALLLLILPLGIFTAFREARSQDATAIIRQVDENMRGEASYNEMTMTTVRPRYSREITMKGWSLGNDYSLIVVTAPARDNGTAFLKRKNEIWNYVPTIDRTVKMPPSMMSQSWMGSDFTNDDLVRGISIVNDYTHTYLGAEVIDRRNYHIIGLKPKPDTPVVYESVVYRIDAEYLLPVKVQNYDETGALVNTVHFRDFTRMGGRLLPATMEMIPENKTGNSTIVTTTKADFGIKLTEAFFSMQNLTTVK